MSAKPERCVVVLDEHGPDRKLVLTPDRQSAVRVLEEFGGVDPRSHGSWRSEVALFLDGRLRRVFVPTRPTEPGSYGSWSSLFVVDEERP